MIEDSGYVGSSCSQSSSLEVVKALLQNTTREDSTSQSITAEDHADNVNDSCQVIFMQKSYPAIPYSHPVGNFTSSINAC